MSSVKPPVVYPVILSGGSGKRLWPLSRSVYPKQFQKVLGQHTLLQSTALRLRDERFAAPAIVCNEEHRFIAAEQFRELDQSPTAIILEPTERNTAPAITIAALRLYEQNPDGLLLVLPSDHVIEDDPQFCDQILALVPDALSGKIVTFGVPPTFADPELGYIKAAQLEAEAIERVPMVDDFVEKPGLDVASKLIREGFSWYSGISLMKAEVYLNEMEAFAPETLSLCKKAWKNRVHDLAFTRLEAESYERITPSSIDKTIMENSARTVMSPLETAWQDIRTWNSVWSYHQKDGLGNAFHGDVVTTESRNSIVHTEHHLAALVGLEDVCVIAADDAILVSSLKYAGNVEGIVDTLRDRNSSKHIHHSTVYRPWGSFHSILSAPGFQVKELMVTPGSSLSLQKHQHRSEHWVVVNGTAEIRRGDDEMLLHENQSVYIPVGTVHRLANLGKIPLHVIEVQTGTYLGEDDIIRLEDTYGRS